MPSIEIVCIGQTEPLDFSLSLAVESSQQLVSQRSPKPLFQLDFDALSGCIYYLGSPDKRNAPVAGCYLAASEILSRESGTEWWNHLIFAPQFVLDLQQMLLQLVDASLTHQLLFTSDYQFGPDEKRYKRPLTLGRFWFLHEQKRLQMNALYWLKP